jgi:hypothetical protein
MRILWIDPVGSDAYAGDTLNILNADLTGESPLRPVRSLTAVVIFGAVTGMKTDPFTIEIIGEMLRASAEEMFLTYARTSQSPIIYEVLDMACGLVTAKGELIAEAEGIPGFIGCLSFAAREILAKFGSETMRRGDVYATNCGPTYACPR